MLLGTVCALVGLVVGVLLGLALSWRSAARRVGAADNRAAAAEREVAVVRAEALALRSAAADRQAVLDEAGRQLAGRFAEVSQQALRQAGEQFLQLAEGRLRGAQEAAGADLEARRRAIDDLLAPLREQLGRYEAGLGQLERDRRQAYGALEEQVRQLASSQQELRVETRNLVTALRAPATRGRWGELQLRRVVEMAGMVDHCDFEEQVQAGSPDGVLRPDMVVRLPGGAQAVVDAKVPLQAFLDAAECATEEERRTQLAAHARQLRAHVDALARKAYWRQFDPCPDFVVAFVPGDALLAAALEHDPGLMEHAVANHVLLATPTLLIALLRSVAYGWQHQALAANARQVQQLGRELYRRLAAFGEHLARVGRSLGSAVAAYNDAVGSLERSVLPQARRFPDLGVLSEAERPVPVLDQLDTVPRAVTGEAP